MISRKYCRLIFLLLASVIGIGMTACSSGTKLPRLDANAVVLAFGDSLTFGTGAESAESYPAILGHLIARKVVNAGVPGEVTDEGLSRLPGLLDTARPALMLLCHGGNDLLRRLDKNQTAGNIRAMIRLAHARNISVILIAVPSPGLSLQPPSIYREIASDLQLPIEEQILTTVLADGSLKSDYIHPNAAGYRRIAEELAALLKKTGAID